MDWNSKARRPFPLSGVTPCVGVWIETTGFNALATSGNVTPCVGVWIETFLIMTYNILIESHPAWVCGLKHSIINIIIINISHTLRGCVDWNEIINTYPDENTQVTPCVGVWIETINDYLDTKEKESHPAWVCGLKRLLHRDLTAIGCHTLRGCVDWNKAEGTEAMAPVSHTLRGCVDWNNDGGYCLTGEQVTPCVGVWIETRKSGGENGARKGHTLRGCVDWNIR